MEHETYYKPISQKLGKLLSQRIYPTPKCPQSTLAATVLLTAVVIFITPICSSGADRLIVKDGSEVETFKVEDDGTVYAKGKVGIGVSSPDKDLDIRNALPGIRLDDTDGGAGQVDLEMSGNTFTIEGNATADIFKMATGAPANSLVIEADGDVGIGTSTPAYSLEFERTGANAGFTMERTDGATAFITGGSNAALFGTLSNHIVAIYVNSSRKMRLYQDDSLRMDSGATCTAGGVWTNASSKHLKENIESLTADEAMDALEGLSPVKYNYKADKKEKYVGFISEEVPELVAMNGRKNMSTMDVVAVLTKVVQEQHKVVEKQQELIREQQLALHDLSKEVSELKKGYKLRDSVASADCK